jgi:hypothetical protein
LTGLSGARICQCFAGEATVSVDAAADGVLQRVHTGAVVLANGAVGGSGGAPVYLALATRASEASKAHACVAIILGCEFKKF